jgi:enterochelin esterase-like enzyme
MRPIIFSIFILLLLANANGQIAIKSLQIVNDTVTFSITSTSAINVNAIIWGLDADPSDTIALINSGSGNWTKKIKAPVGFYYYEYLVDETPIFDRSVAGVFREKERWLNAFEIRNSLDSFDIRKNGPFGNINICNYKSKATGNWRQCMVYTPAEYDELSAVDYPVVYLLHDSGEDESAWLYQGVVNDILDNAIAQDSTLPMIIVLENITAITPAGSPNAGKDLLDSVVVYDLVPFIDSVFHTVDSSAFRAIAGCADGGAKAIDIFQKHNTSFNNLGVFSLPVGYDFNSADPSEILTKERGLIFASAGLADANFYELQQWHVDLVSASVEHVWYTNEGNYNWMVWRKSLNEMSKLLFKENN